MWEVPLNLQDCAVGERKGENGYGYGEVINLLSLVAEAGGVATLSWHPDRFSDPGFRPLAAMYKQVVSSGRRRRMH